MKTINTISVMVLIAFLAGCASMDARDRLATAEKAYSATVDTAIELRRSGVMDDETARKLTPAFVEADEFLERAHRAIVDGELGLAEEWMRAAEALILVITRKMRQDE